VEHAFRLHSKPAKSEPASAAAVTLSGITSAAEADSWTGYLICTPEGVLHPTLPPLLILLGQHQGHIVGLLAAADPVGHRVVTTSLMRTSDWSRCCKINSISRSSPNSPNSFSGSVMPSL